MSEGSGDDPVAEVGNVEPPPQAPPGWYAPRDQSGVLRWWDGLRWTAHTASPHPRDQPQVKGRSRKRLVVVTTLSVLGGAVLMFGSLLLYAMASGSAHDARSLDDEEIRRRATTSCLELASVLESRTLDRVADIRAGNTAIHALVDDLEGLGEDTLADDPPAVDWIGDWKQLASSREAFAEALQGGASARFAVPTTDGYPITERMTDVAPEECSRTVQLASMP